MIISLAAAFVVLHCVAAVADAARPLALHFAVNVSANSENVIPLRTYDVDGDYLCEVILLPSTGTLSQIRTSTRSMVIRRS